MPSKKKALADSFTLILKEKYPDIKCSLEYDGSDWKLLIMGRLSAQCTDARVNIVAKTLFVKFPTLQAFADADITALEESVKPCGLYKTKAKSIKEACIMLTEKFGGRVPDDMDSLLSLPGVGRKIANLLLGDIFRKPVIVTDTHCIRICGRIGLYPESLKGPHKVENILVPLIEPDESADFCHRLVQFGRDVCTARNPKCTECPANSICKHYSKMKDKTND